MKLFNGIMQVGCVGNVRLLFGFLVPILLVLLLADLCYLCNSQEFVTTDYVNYTRTSQNESLVSMPPTTTEHDASMVSMTSTNKDHTLPTRTERFIRDGDVFLGGLFDIHSELNGQVNPLSLHWMYAMVYGVEVVNKRSDILPGIKLGFDIHDTRAEANTAVSNSLDFITSSDECDSSSGLTVFGDTGVVAVIGPRTNAATEDTANLYSLFELPQIAYAATSPVLSNSQFTYLSRTVPPVNTQITALTDIILYHKWQTVMMLYSDDLVYGREVSLRFSERARESGICIAYSRRFGQSSTDEEIASIVSHMRMLENIQVIVAIVEESAMIHLLDYFVANDVTGYIWLGTAAWSVSSHLTKPEYATVLKGMIGLVPHVIYLEDFDDYLRNLPMPDDTVAADPFLTEYWEERQRCRLSAEEMKFSVPCDESNHLSADDPFFSTYPSISVFHSVEVIARGLHDTLRCNATMCLGSLNDFSPYDLLEYIRNNSFMAFDGRIITPNGSGDLLSSAWYDVRNLQPDADCSGKFVWNTVTEWREEIGYLPNLSNPYWPHFPECNWQSSIGVEPQSFCSTDCKPGQRVSFHEETDCCWDCVGCDHYTYSNTKNANICFNCEENQTANHNRTGCEDLQMSYLKLDNVLGLSLFLICVIGILIDLITIYIFIAKRITRMYHNFGLRLYVFDVICYLTPLLCLLPVTDLTCIVRAVFQLLPVTILQTYAILAALGKVIKRINIPLRTRVLWHACVLLIHGFCLIIWIVYSPPAKSVLNDRPLGYTFVDCKSEGVTYGAITIFLFQVALDVLGATIAFGIRKSKSKFYEGKFLFFVFVVHGMFWGVVSTMIIIVPAERHDQVFITSVSIAITGMIFYGTLFVPKLYALKHKPMAVKRSIPLKQQWKFKRKISRQMRMNLKTLRKKEIRSSAGLLHRSQCALLALNTEINKIKETQCIIDKRVAEINERYATTMHVKKSCFGRLRDVYVHHIIHSCNIDGTQL